VDQRRALIDNSSIKTNEIALKGVRYVYLVAHSLVT